MSEKKGGEPTPKENEGGELTPKEKELNTQLESVTKEFEEYREKQKTVEKSKEARFFKEGATKVEAKLREIHEIEEKLTGDELYEAISNKLKTKVEESKTETSEETLEKFKQLEAKVAEKENELLTYKQTTLLNKKRNAIKSIANPILNSGEFKLSENGLVNEQRLTSALASIEGLNIDFEGVEATIVGEDNLPVYVDGKKVTLIEKIKQNLSVFFDQAPKGQPSLSLLNGEGKKIEITSSIAEIDKQLKTAKTQEEFLKLSEQKAKLINDKK